MKTIKYFDGRKVHHVQVNDAVIEGLRELRVTDNRNYYVFTNLETPFNYEDGETNDLDTQLYPTLESEIFLERTLSDKFHETLSKLSDKHQLLVRRHYFDNMTESEIARLSGVSQSAISQQLKTEKSKLKKLFQKTL